MVLTGKLWQNPKDIFSCQNNVCVFTTSLHRRSNISKSINFVTVCTWAMRYLTLPNSHSKEISITCLFGKVLVFKARPCSAPKCPSDLIQQIPLPIKRWPGQWRIVPLNNLALKSFLRSVYQVKGQKTANSQVGSKAPKSRRFFSQTTPRT